MTSLALGDDEGGARLRQLPAFDPAELTRAVGFVKVVRRFIALPLLVLGLLATMAAIVTAHPVSAAIAALVTFALQWSLFDDMRLAHALDLVRRGRIEQAERRLLAIALPVEAGGPGRQRARVVLAALAWRRGELERALAWIRAAAVHEQGSGADPDRIVELGTSEVMLLALLGRGGDAATRLRALPIPRSDDQKWWRIHVELLTAFANDEVAAVRDELDGWAPIVASHDAAGPTSALMAWAYDADARHHEAVGWRERAQAVGDPELMRRRYHALAVHLDGLAAARQWSRR